jgi:hypothetical protein
MIIGVLNLCALKHTTMLGENMQWRGELGTAAGTEWKEMKEEFQVKTRIE